MEREVLLETFPVNSRGGEILGKAELFPMSAESSRCSLALAIPALSSIYIHVQANNKDWTSHEWSESANHGVLNHEADFTIAIILIEN